MKRRTWFLLAATYITAPFTARALLAKASNEPNDDVAPTTPDAERNPICYIGSNARWLVDKRQGVVSAWSLTKPQPLWSRDGVVFRLNKRPTRVVSDFSHLTASQCQPTTEFFERVYFLLDDPTTSDAHKRRDALLVALDLRAQGRLVWKLDVNDFLRFFPDSTPLRFLNNLKRLPNDELLISVQGAQSTKSFAINAAVGTCRPVEALN